ncbi:MAG: FxsA protein [Thiobacillus sp.]|nr:FxsA protein [Thiobacillus sp.]
MRFSWIVLLMLSFPVLEAIGIFWAASVVGGWVLLWLLLAAVAGVMLIRVERVVWGARLMFSMQSGENPLASLFASGRILLAGGLLVFPGFISDVIALVLLLIPGTWTQRRPDPLRSANDDAPPAPQPSFSRGEGANVTPTTINGEFKREPDDLLR